MKLRRDLDDKKAEDRIVPVDMNDPAAVGLGADRETGTKPDKKPIKPLKTGVQKESGEDKAKKD